MQSRYNLERLLAVKARRVENTNTLLSVQAQEVSDQLMLLRTEVQAKDADIDHLRKQLQQLEAEQNSISRPALLNHTDDGSLGGSEAETPTQREDDAVWDLGGTVPLARASTAPNDKGAMVDMLVQQRKRFQEQLQILKKVYSKKG